MGKMFLQWVSGGKKYIYNNNEVFSDGGEKWKS